jgi:NAD kinase
MKRLTENKIVLITRPTRLEELVSRFNTPGQAKFYVEHLGANFNDYESEHRTYKTALQDTELQLRALGRVQVLERVFLTNFVFGQEDTVLVLGQDGLVANTLKYLGEQPIIAVNPDPARWDGVLLPFGVNDVSRIVIDVFARRRAVREITMARAKLTNGQMLYGVNDLFIGPKSHISARYQISIGDRKEQQSSSGIIVSTGLGSTGWFKSILAGARGIGRTFGKPIDTDILDNFRWESDYLYYTVREPFPSKSSAATLVFGKIDPKAPLELVSQMPEHGVIFSDGIEADYLEFNAGMQAVISVADKKGHLVV